MKRWRDLSREGWYSATCICTLIALRRKTTRCWRRCSRPRTSNSGVDLQLMYDLVFIMHQLYGQEGRHQEGNHMVVPGQETPRGSQWGHFNAIDVSKFFPPKTIWRRTKYCPLFEGRCCGGYEPCHVGSVGASNGLAMNMPIAVSIIWRCCSSRYWAQNSFITGLIWGTRITPTAGTDFPVMGHIGQERTFVHVDGQAQPGEMEEIDTGGQSLCQQRTSDRTQC